MDNTLKSWIVSLTQNHKKYLIPPEYLENRGEKYFLVLKEFTHHIYEKKAGELICTGDSYKEWDYKLPYEEMRVFLSMLDSFFPTKTYTSLNKVTVKEVEFVLGKYECTYQQIQQEDSDPSWAIFVCETAA